jgi:glycosyltransferase involved in cell wall biosynthesis
VITISEADAQSIRDLYHTERVSHVTPGVDAHYFCKPPSAPHRGNFVFVGALSWNANVDGIVWFVREILPKIRSRYPDCTLSIVGGSPPPEVLKFAQEDKGIEVTGRVPDIRPWLWGSDISILPIRIGGGVRIKLYESMAAGTPAVSTSIGAQGLDVTPGENILIADTAQDFADKCIGLLGDAEERRRIAHVASEMVRTRYSWEQTVEQLEAILAKSALGN